MDETTAVTTEQVRAAVVAAGFSAEAFGDWLDEHDQKVRHEGWKDGADWAEQYGQEAEP